MPSLRHAAVRESMVTGALATLGLTQLALGALLCLAPATFYDEIAPFAPRNDHFLRDGGTFTLALALLLLVAVRAPSWRVPALAASALQSVLHTVSHLIDIGNADPRWLGYANFIGVALQATLAAALLAVAFRTGARP